MEPHYFTAWYREVQRHATMHLFRNEKEPGLSLLSQRLLGLLMIHEINYIWTAEMKWRWRNDRRSERNLCNCVKKPEKNSGLQRGLNPWPRDYRCDGTGTVTRNKKKNKPIADKRVTSNDPRNNCEKHFDSSSLVVSKVATAAKFPNFNNRDFKIQRRGRQRERQKNIRFNFRTCIALICSFLSRFCTTTTWKCLISRFMENVNKQRRNFISLSELEFGPLKFSFRRVRLQLTK